MGGKVFASRWQLIKRFIEFGYIDNDLIIVYEEDFEITPKQDKDLVKSFLSVEEYRGYLKGKILDEVKLSQDVNLLEKIKNLLGEG